MYGQTGLNNSNPGRRMPGDIFVGRQPIFDRYLRVIGYELLYRSYGAEQAIFLDGDKATSEVILNSFADIGLEGIVGQQKAFINLTRNFFLEKYPIPFTPRQLIIEVPETLVLDSEILASIKEFSKLGYQIALDDVTSLHNLIPLLKVADIIKIDIREIDQSQIQRISNQMMNYPAKLLAEKVETKEEFDYCLAHGFDYFQGYFLSKPNIVAGKQIASSRLVLLQLLSKLQDPEVSFEKLEQIIAQDAVLGYKLLRLTNSAYYGIASEVRSIRQAMALLGIEKLRSWMTLIMLAEKQDKPRELTITAMVRARMCELLAQASRSGQQDSYFLAGLLSSLDAILDMPLEEILTNINLSDDIKRGLLEGNGKIGEAVHCAVAYEHASWDNVFFSSLASEDIRDVYLKSLQWVETIRAALNLQ